MLDEVCAVGFEFDRWKFHDAHGNLVVDVPSQLGGDGIPPNRASPAATCTTSSSAPPTAPARGRPTARPSPGSRTATAPPRSRCPTGARRSTTSSSASTASTPRRASACSATPTSSVYSGFGVWRVTTPRPDHITYGALYQAPGAKAGHIPLSQELMYLLLVHPEPHHARFDRSQHVDMLRERLAPFEGVVGDIREKELEGLNRERQSVEERILREAVAEVESWPESRRRRRGYVVAGEGWHEGVIGIVASRLVER